MLEEQIIPINYGQGVDTKTDPKLVVAGKMLRLENAVFTTANRLTKRNGYQVLGSSIANNGSLTAPKMVHQYQNELIAADKNLLLSYSPNQNAWESRGGYISTELTKNSIDQETVSSGAVDNAVLGKYILYAYSTATRIDGSFPAAFPSDVWGQVVDSDTGTILNSTNLFHAVNAEYPNPVRAVLLANSTLALIYADLDSNKLFLVRVIFSGSGVVSFSAPLQISTNFTSFCFDVVPTSSGAVITYLSVGGLTVTQLDSGGNISATTTVVDANAKAPLCLSVNSFNGSIWVYWVDSGSNNIVYSVFSGGLLLVLAKTVVVNLPAPHDAINMMAISTSATQQTLFYGSYVAIDLTHSVDESFRVLVSSTGVVAPPAYFAGGLIPYSHDFLIGSDSYAVFLYRGISNLPATIAGVQIQPTFFLIRLTNIPSNGVPLVAARIGYGISNAQLYVLTTLSYNPNLSALISNKIIFSCALETQEFKTDSFVLANASVPGGISGSFTYYIDFASNNAYKAVECGGLSILNGGLIQAYDGKSCNEWNFNVVPEMGDPAPTVSTGTIGNGVYSYISIYQWIDNQGNLHQSDISDPVKVTVAGAENTVLLTITKSVLTQKQGATVTIYRTQNGGSTYFQITDPIFLTPMNENSPPPFISFTDTLPDASIAGNPQPYTSPGSPILANSTPPPSMAMVSHNNRLFFVDSENPNTIWYTKSFSPGFGLSPSSLMTEQLDPKFGYITALSEMDDKLVVLKQNGIVVQSGDGVNDVGSNQTFSFPQFVPSDVGCDSLKSVVTMPSGVMFHSANGIYILSRSLSIEYIGMAVEQYNNETITSANLVTSKSQIRFLALSGLTLVYDYIFNQWSTFTNHTGLSADLWQGNYVYATNSGLIFKEVNGYYLDNVTAFQVLLQTSWLALSSVQNFQRVKRLIMLGDFTNGVSGSHELQVQAAYDFSTTFGSPIPYTFGAPSISRTFQYRERLPQQKCDAISLLISEVTTGDSSEYVDLTNISFEAGLKRGANKLPATQSVG